MQTGVASFMATLEGCVPNRLLASLPLSPTRCPPHTHSLCRTHKGRLRCSLSSALSCGRRQLSTTTLFILYQFNANALPADVKATELPKALDKYVKRKKLDPLETYVPAILLSQDQFEEIEQELQSDNPKYADSRSLLRSGPAASLRVNIRAIAQYASEAGNGKVASDAVDQCVSALEELDSLLFRASRNDSKASIVTMKSKVQMAVAALNRLLQTVPSPVLDKGKVIADAYRESTELTMPEEGGSKDSNSDIKLLEKIF